MQSLELSFLDEELINIIKDGELVSFPTDTIFGVGCIYDQKEAFDKLVALKKRPPEKPFTLMLSNKELIKEFAYVNDRINRVIDSFLPGELTLILKVKNTYPWVSLNSTTIGIRVSGLKEVCSMIERVNKPLLVTSVNESGQSPLNDFASIKSEFDGKIKAIVNLKGYKNSSTASTIVYMVEDEIKLIRQGKIDYQDIYKVWEGNL